MTKTTPSQNHKVLKQYRWYFTVAWTVYFSWWFAVEFLLPQSFNPFLSRVIVCAVIFGIWATSYFVDKVREKIRRLYVMCAWLITIHYFYLFYGNKGEIDWVIGAYISVIAINLTLLSPRELLSYSGFIIACSAALVFLLPDLQHSVFFPGMITILIQANLGMRSRLLMIQSLEESNKRFQLLFNSTFEGVLVHEHGFVVNVNDALVSMFGFSREEFIGKYVFDILHPTERQRAMEGLHLDSTAPYETKGLTRNGVVLDLEFRAKNFKDGKTLARLVTVLDISDRKRVETEKIKTLAMKENVRIRDEFISIASHELRTPISTLKLQTQIIERDLKKSDQRRLSLESALEFIGLFHRQINRLTELVEAMLDVSRISSGKLNLEVQEFDFAKLIREIVATLQLHAENARALFQLNLPDSMLVVADQARIEQVVENILTNALKYGSGKVVQIRLHQQGSDTLFEVEDHGIGIAAEHIERIFDRFERAISPRNISGLGLGLYIARQIMEAHNGSISVKSELGHGSTFTVRVPIRYQNH